MKNEQVIKNLAIYLIKHNIEQISLQQIMSVVYDMYGRKELAVNIIGALIQEGIVEKQSAMPLGESDFIYNINFLMVLHDHHK